MQHYVQTKNEYKDCVLFYRLGDFYEMFFEDAVTVSRELELTLTGKDCGLEERAPMCGVPFHAAETYINRLIEKGYKVAICEQVEDNQSINVVELNVNTLTTMLMGYKRPTYLYDHEKIKTEYYMLTWLERLIPVEKPYFSDYF